MDIRCPQCDTLYEFDESRVNSGSATLKCRKCQHMFRLGSDAQPSREDQQRWMVREPNSGDILYFNSFETLHRWIVEREIDRNWEISRTGDEWKTLGDVGEFRPIFQVVDNVSSLEPDDPQPGTTEKAPEREARAKKDTLDQFDSQGNGSAPESGAGTAARPPGAQAERSDSGTGDQFPAATNSLADGGSAAPDVVEPEGASSSASDDEPTDPTASGADASAPIESEPSAPNSSGRQSKSRTPSGSQPAAPSPSSSQPMDAAEPGGRQRQRSPSPAPSQAVGPAGESTDQSDVQLDSGRFGNQSSRESESAGSVDATDDQWAFGEEEVGYDETTNPNAEEVEYYSGGSRRWPTVLTVAVVVAAGAAAYLVQRDLVDSWLAGSETTQAVDVGKSAAPPKDKGGGAVEAGRSALTEGVSTAADRAREKGVELFETARGEADGVVVEALGKATKTAKEKANEKKRVSTVELLGQAQSDLENGNSGAARRKFHQVIERDPQNSEAITGLGWTLMNIGKTEAAIAQFKKALHHNPSYGDAYIGLGQANQAVGNSRKALDAYQKYLDKFPGGSKASIAEYQAKQLKKSLGIE
ncbi:MAG: tetratricopeptide repeat protein [Bradymonadaceae bacterium]